MRLLLTVLIFLILPETYAQADKLLIKHCPAERIRIVNEYLEEDTSNSPDTVRKYLHEVAAFARKNKDKALAKEVSFLLDVSPLAGESDARVMLRFLENLAKGKYAKDEYYYARLLHKMGQVQFVLQNYSLAFENMTIAGKIFREIGYRNVPVIGKFFHTLALDYYYFRNYDEAIEVMLESTKWPAYSKNLDLQRYNTLGMSYLRKKELDKAHFYFNKALSKAVVYKNTTWIGLVSGNIGDVLFQKGDYKGALTNLLLDYKISKEGGKYPEIIRNSASGLAEVYIHLDSIEKAKYYIKRTEEVLMRKDSLRFGEQQQYEIGKKLYFNNLYLINLKERKYEAALRYLDTLRKTEALENEMYNSTLVKLVEGNVQMQESQEKIALQTQQHERLKFRNTLYIFVLVLAAGLGYFLFYVNTMRKRRDEAKRKITELENERMKADLADSRNEIRNFVKKINEKNHLIEKVTAAIENLEKHHSIKEIELETTLHELRSTKILTDGDWAEFQINFDKNYPDFTAKVRELFPQITSSELRYIMLSKINLDHKQMANALGISSDAIRVTWSRVKKKTKSLSDQTPEGLIQEIDNQLSGT